MHYILAVFEQIKLPVMVILIIYLFVQRDSIGFLRDRVLTIAILALIMAALILMQLHFLQLGLCVGFVVLGLIAFGTAKSWVRKS